MERIFKEETKCRILAVFHAKDVALVRRIITATPQVCNQVRTDRGYFLDRVETKEGLVYHMIKLSPRLKLYPLCSCGAYPFKHRTGSGQCEMES